MSIDFLAATPLRRALRRNFQGLGISHFTISRHPATGYNLVLYAPTQSAGQHMIDNLLAIAAIADNTMPLNEIIIQGHCATSVKMESLKALWPDETRCLGGSLDLIHRMDCLGEYRLLRDAVLQESASDRSLFLLDPNGIYHDIHLSIGADPPCPAIAMAGKTVGQIMGPEAYHLVVVAIRLALGQNQRGMLAYPGWVNGERRHYVANLKPIPKLQKVLMVVNRTS